MTNSVASVRTGYYPAVKKTRDYDADLEAYASLFVKPISNNKCAFSRKELEVMCKDPMHSPRLIVYLIEFIKNM
jgi:hypothetical protein